MQLCLRNSLQARSSNKTAGSRQTSAVPGVAGSCVPSFHEVSRHTVLAVPDAAIRSIADADTANQQPIPQQQQAPRGFLKLTKRHRPLSFYKWQKKLYMQLLELEQEQALLAAPDSEEWYYSYWDCPDAHLPGLQDKPYQAAWAAVFEAAGPAVFQDKVVLDVGCGLGTLAMAAAKAGAKHVYAVDASPGAAELARKVIAANGLSNRITVITGRAELVQLPVRQKSVDVIVSDWMGSMLLHDGLLPALIRARDKWLSPNGVILPDAASLHVMAVDDRQYLVEQSKLWSGRQLGLGEAELKPVLNGVIRHPRLDSISRRAQLVTDSQQLLQLDLYKATLQDLTFHQDFTLTAQRDEGISGLLTCFDATFTCRGRIEQPVTFSTNPLAPSTSWLQLVFSFPRSIKMKAGQQLSGSFKVEPVGIPIGRMLAIDVDINFQGMKAQVAYQLKR